MVQHADIILSATLSTTKSFHDSGLTPFITCREIVIHTIWVSPSVVEKRPHITRSGVRTHVPDKLYRREHMWHFYDAIHVAEGGRA